MDVGAGLSLPVVITVVEVVGGWLNASLCLIFLVREAYVLLAPGRCASCTWSLPRP
jgi:hypothetical protein